MIEAGSETTSSALNSVIKFLEAYPDVQRKAREEIFSAVGNDRTRTYSDNLPYIRAIGK
jgi:cytochrome P450